jgi:hypothetical protein
MGERWGEEPGLPLRLMWRYIRRLKYECCYIITLKLFERFKNVGFPQTRFEVPRQMDQGRTSEVPRRYLGFYS